MSLTGSFKRTKIRNCKKIEICSQTRSQTSDSRDCEFETFSESIRNTTTLRQHPKKIHAQPAPPGRTPRDAMLRKK